MLNNLIDGPASEMLPVDRPKIRFKQWTGFIELASRPSNRYCVGSVKSHYFPGVSTECTGAEVRAAVLAYDRRAST